MGKAEGEVLSRFTELSRESAQPGTKEAGELDSGFWLAD